MEGRKCVKKVRVLNVRSKRSPSYNDVIVLMIHERDKAYAPSILLCRKWNRCVRKWLS